MKIAVSWCVPGQPSKAEPEEHDEPDKDDAAWRMVHDGILLLPSERPPSQHLLQDLLACRVARNRCDHFTTRRH